MYLKLENCKVTKEHKMFSDTAYSDFSSQLLKQAYTAVKYNLNNVLHSFKFCAVCLSKGEDSFYEINISKFNKRRRRLEVEEDSSVEGMMIALFSDQVLKKLCNNYICELCEENLRQAYTFIKQVKNHSQIVDCYLQQINKYIDGVESLLDSPEDNNFTNTVIVLKDSIDDENDFNQKEKEEDFKIDVSYPDNDIDDDTINIVSKIFICDYCSESFDTKKKIANHIKKLHMPRRTSKKHNECPDCATTPCIHEKYLKHIQNIKYFGTRKFICLDCDHIASNKMYLIGHINREHLNLLPHLCEHCGQSFATRNAHKSHLKINHQVILRCQYCDKQYKDDSIRGDHEKICQNIKRQHACNHCRVSFYTKEELQFHVKRHTQWFPCKFCSRSFIREASLKRHNIVTHNIGNYNIPKPRPHLRERSCSICPQKFTKWTKLKEHMSKHKPDERHYCEICKRTFETRNIYQSHCRSWVHIRRIDPTRKFNIKCDDCEYTCVSANLLENHKNLFHLKIRPYICDQCPKTFTTKTHLKNHMDSHEGIKKFKCKECGLSLVTKSAMNKHFLRYHVAEKPHPCDFCEKSFVNLSEKDLHTKRHHSKRTVGCPVCGGMFHTRSNARHHIRSVHAKHVAIEEFLKDYEHDAGMMEIFRDHRKPFVETNNS